jgi:hypothetical protein
MSAKCLDNLDGPVVDHVHDPAQNKIWTTKETKYYEGCSFHFLRALCGYGFAKLTHRRRSNRLANHAGFAYDACVR